MRIVRAVRMAAALAILSTTIAAAGGVGDAAAGTVQAPDGVLSRGTAGLRAVIDPATGQLVVGGGAAQVEARQLGELAEALSTSHDGLVEEFLGAAEGYRVDLRGRFQSVVFASLGADGKVTVGHAAPPVPVPLQREEPATAGDVAVPRATEGGDATR